MHDHKNHSGHHNSLKAIIVRYALSVLAMVGLGASCQVCPFCGQPACPTGTGFGVFLGVIVATAANIGLYFGRVKAFVKRKFKPKK